MSKVVYPYVGYKGNGDGYSVVLVTKGDGPEGKRYVWTLGIAFLAYTASLAAEKWAKVFGVPNMEDLWPDGTVKEYN